MQYPSNVRRAALVTVVTFGLSTMGPFQASMGALPEYPGAPRVAQAAAGQPIFDCSGMQATSARLKAGLPIQEEWIRRTEAQWRAAEDGVTQSKAALQDLALKSAVDLVEHQLSMVREFENAIESARGFSSINRAKWLGRVDDIKQMAEGIEGVVQLGTAGLAGNNLGVLMQKNRATLQDFINMVQDGGISDELGIKAASFAGPAGVSVVETFVVARDVSLAVLEGRMNINEAAAARENVEQMRAAKTAVESRAYELDGILTTECAPRPAPPNDRILVEGPAQPPQPEPASGPSTVKVVAGVAGVTGAAIVGAMAYGEYKKSMDEAAALTATAPRPPTTGSGGSSGGGTASTVQVTISGVMTCTLSSAGTFRTCSGASARAVFSQSFTSQVIVAVTGPYPFNASQTVTGNTATFNLASGGATVACPPNQVQIAFYRNSASGTQIATVSTSVTVRCVG
jgi:hypothetical protein